MTGPATSRPATPRIDAHQHFWRPSRGDYRWLTPDLHALYRPFEPDDLAPILARHGVTGTVLVQAADTVAETRFMLGLADACGFVDAVVGWADLERDDADASLAALASHPRLRGVRPMLQDIPDPDWMLRPAVRRGLEAAERLGLVLDALVLPVHLSRLRRVAEGHPGLAIVIDHAAKPRIDEGARWAGLSEWRDDLAALAALPNVTCKLSGLATEAGPDWRADDLRPCAEAVLAQFGAERVLWGSDWPVVELAGGYDRWAEATRALLADLDDDARAAVLGGNAVRVYGIDLARPRRAAPPSGEHTT